MRVLPGNVKGKMPFKSPLPQFQSPPVRATVAAAAAATGGGSESALLQVQLPEPPELARPSSAAENVGSAASASRPNWGSLLSLATPARPPPPPADAPPALARWWRVSYRSDLGFGSSQKKKKEYAAPLAPSPSLAAAVGDGLSRLSKVARRSSEIGVRDADSMQRKLEASAQNV